MDESGPNPVPGPIASAGETPSRAPAPSAWDDPAVVNRIREMPGGIRLFLVYALSLLAVIGLSMRYVIDLAIGAPVSPTGVVVMVLLAYTIFTITLARKSSAGDRLARESPLPLGEG